MPPLVNAAATSEQHEAKRLTQTSVLSCARRGNDGTFAKFVGCQHTREVHAPGVLGGRQL
eukprot:scaffold77108_cov64-Phaeocystis_antarctica.AAC.5